MINTPYPVPSPNMPGQNVPVQTSYNHFPTFQQPQTVPQQMQTGPSVYPTNPQEPYKPYCKAHQAEMFATSHYQMNTPWPPVYQPGTVPGMQTQSNPGPLSQNVLDQIRSCVGNTAPIFILPSCHQPASHQQSQASQCQQPVQSTLCCTPSFYPYPIPMPVFNSFGGQNRAKDGYGCCCYRRSQDFNGRVHMCGCDLQNREEHQCTATSDGTICSRKDCPVAISLQALASQLLSLPGIISCAVTRLILRKIPGSNITCTMEDTMDKALKSIESLSKNQLLAESRNAQQVNALINLHMTSNPPANIIPLLTLFQLKVNALKAQVENLINKKVMECQSCYGCEVETSGPIDPTILTMKTNAELRDLLTALRQKECDERVNVNFSPYHSQKVIAEARLNNVQAKIQQVEAEFDRRRDCALPIPTLTSRVIQQFSESRCTYGFAQARLFEPYAQNAMESPDPFTPRICNPKRLCLKPGELNEKYISTTNDVGVSPTQDTGTGDCSVDCAIDKAVEPKSSVETCTCISSSSDDSLDEAKKKLRLNVDRKGLVTLTSVKCRLKDVPLLMLTPNVVTRIGEDLKKIEEVSEQDVEEELLEFKLEPETEVLEKDDDEDNVEQLRIRRKGGREKYDVITISDVEEDEQAKLRDGKQPNKEIEIIVISDDEDEEGIDIEKEKIEEQDEKEILVITISDDEEEDIDQKKVENEPERVIKKESIEEKIKPAPPWKVAHTAKTWQAQPEMEIKEEPKVANPKKKTELVTIPRFDTATVREEDKESKPEKEPYVKSKRKISGAVKFLDKLMKPKIAPGIILNRKEPQAAMKDIEEPKKKEPQPYIISKKELIKAIKTLGSKEKVPIDTPKESKIGTVPKTIKPQVPVEEIEKPEIERYIISKKKLMEAIKTIETKKTEEIDPKDRLDLSGIKDLYKQVGTTLGDIPMAKDIPVTPQPMIVGGPSGITWTSVPFLGSSKPPRNPDDKKKTNPKSDGGLQKSKIGGNVQIVSMMNHIEYTQQFGDFWGAKINECMQEDERTRNFESTNVERAHITDDAQIVSEKVNTSIIFVNQQYGPSMISVATETSMQKISLSQKMFPKLGRSENKEVNGLNPFPPLKESDTMGTETTETISENVFHQRGIESGWKTVCDRGSSCWDSEIEDSIVSAIYSTIENQIASFTSLLRNVPSVRLNKMPSNGSSLPSQRDSMRNKKIQNAKDDWVFLPLNAYDERSASARNRISVSKIREMKQSIIVDKETNKYLLVGGSVNSNELGFKRPYQTRRFLVIRSRLKNPANSKHEQPFTIVKRSRRTKVPRIMRRERKKKFSSLPKIPEEMETLSNDSSEFVNVENETLSETSSSEFVKISENEISQLMNEYDMDENNNYASDSIESKQRIYSYSGNI